MSLKGRQSYFANLTLLEAIKVGKSPNIYWFETLKNLPSDLFLELIRSRELIEYEKQDSREYWENNSDLATDYLNDLEANNQITEDEFNQLINSDEEGVAKVLVDKGFFCENYSFWEKTKRQKDRKENDLWGNSDDYEYQDSSLDFYILNTLDILELWKGFKKLEISYLD